MSFPTGFDLRALRAFLLVAELGSMTAAAKQLGITQSSMSEAIGELEAAIGTKLFDRSVRPIALTAAGRSLHQSAHGLVNLATDVLHAARDADQLGLSSLTLAMVESFANTVGPILYRELSHLAKRWRIWSGISPDLHTALMNRSADIIVTSSEDIDAIEGLERHLIVTEGFVIALPPTWSKDSEIDQLIERPFIRYSQRSAIGRQIEQQINRMRLPLPFHAEFDSSVGPIAAVAAGLGWSITTPLCLAHDIHMLNQIAVVPLSRGSFQRRLTMVSRAYELTDVAGRLADISRRRLLDAVFPDLLKDHEWLRGYVNVGA